MTDTFLLPIVIIIVNDSQVQGRPPSSDSWIAEGGGNLPADSEELPV